MMRAKIFGYVLLLSKITDQEKSIRNNQTLFAQLIYIYI